MIIIGGERPVVADPEPRYGSLLSSLNRLRMKIESKQSTEDSQTSANLTYLANALANFSTLCDVPLTNHINSTGPQHGETADTVGLGKVDNLRTATITDHLNFVDNAFVTPAGITAAVNQSISGFNKDDFQHNVRMPFAMLHYIDQFLRADKDPGTPTFFRQGPATLIMNGDRVIVSPRYLSNNPGPYSLYYSDTVKMRASLGLNEERQVAQYYNGTGWNMKGARDNTGRIGIFRPLANKGIYDYASSVPGQGNFFVLLSTTFGDISHKGCLISAAWTNNQLVIGHYFFGISDPENNPVMAEIVTSSYKAVYNTVNMTNVSDAINRSRTINLTDFFSLGAGVKIESALPAGEHPSISADWRYLNLEFLMNFSMPVKVTVGNKVFNKIFTFTESVHPGKLVIADTGDVTLLKGMSKDVIITEADLANSKWLVDNDPTNLLNLVACPGVINNNGLVLNAYTTPASLRVKITPTDIDGVIPLLEDPSMKVSVKESISQTFVPTRHFSFGELPERIIPISQDTNQVIYLSFCLAVDKFGFKYKELNWQSGSNTSQSGSVYGVTRPVLITERDISTEIPRSLVSLTTPTGGVVNSALAFTEANDYKARASFQYLNGGFVLGAEVQLAPNSLIALKTHKNAVESNSLASPAYGGHPENYAREMQMGAFLIGETKALCFWSDGISYAEACVVPCTLSNNLVTLSLRTDTARFVVTPNTTASLGNRESSSGDGLQSNHSDLLVYKVDANSLTFVLNRPFGRLSGDVSFTTTNFSQSYPQLTARYTTPARTYAGTDFFDLSAEHYPPALLPKIGAFQNTVNSDQGVILTRVGGSETFTPYMLAGQKLVIIPEGYRCVINGVGISIDETQELAYSTVPSYFYIEENTGIIELKRYDAQQKPDNNAVMIGYDSDGTGVRYTRSYIVVDKKLISSDRKGATIPFVVNDGTERGATQFFLKKDVF